MNPNTWGPYGWYFLHALTFAYPMNIKEEDKSRMINFINLFKELIPCDNCKKNFRNHLIKYPLTDDILSSRQTLIIWMLNIHNEVNKITRKPQYLESDLRDKFSYINTRNPLVIHTNSLLFFKYILLNLPFTPNYQDKNRLNDFFEILKYIYPNFECRAAYKNALEKYDFEKYTTNRELILSWYQLIYDDILQK